MQGRSGARQYGNAQAAAMQRQMMQNRYRMMQFGMGSQNGTGQQQRLRDGSCGGQYGSAQAGAMQRQMMQNRYRMMQSGMGGQNGIGQQQRLRDGSSGGQIGSGEVINAAQMQRMQNRARRNQ